MIAALMMLTLTSCYEMRVEVVSVPSNTPEDATIYITGNFNRWDPGDPRYALEKRDSIYYVDLPRGIGELEYKFTRGDWTTVEKGICGEEISNRENFYSKEEETVRAEILSWSDLDPVDCQHLTIAITSIPDNTPPDPRIVIAGNVNNWNPAGEQYVFSRDTATGYWILSVPRASDIEELEFLVTRGSLERSEADALGEDIKPRVAEFGRQDTLFIEVLSWEDLERQGENLITLIVDKIPPNTPPGDPIYFVGEINDWFPKQGSLMLEKDRKGRYFINLPRRAAGKPYKFTRGGWGKVEKDKYGYEIENRILHLEKGTDTVVVNIENWADLSDEAEDEITIRVTDLPESTPEGAGIYLASNFNLWNPGSQRWKLQEAADGTYYINIPRSQGTLAFKFTRGSWFTAESTAYGDEIENRTYLYKDIEDIEVSIEGWIDKGGK